MREINLIVIHCADTPKEMDIGVNEIRQWHLERGWNDIGYHFVINRAGFIEAGRPVEEVGAHVKGYNSNSIGICLVGGKGGFNFNWFQLIALRRLVENLKKRYPIAKVKGHCDLDSGKTCPQFDVEAFFSNESIHNAHDH